MRIFEDIIAVRMNADQDRTPGVLVTGNRGSFFIWKPRDDNDQSYQARKVDVLPEEHDGSFEDPLWIFLREEDGGDFLNLGDAIEYARGQVR